MAEPASPSPCWRRLATSAFRQVGPAKLSSDPPKGAGDAAGNSLFCREAPVGIEPTNRGFADLCLTTWLRRREGQTWRDDTPFSTHPKHPAETRGHFIRVLGEVGFRGVLHVPQRHRRRRVTQELLQ